MHTLSWLAFLARLNGDFPRARTHSENALQFGRETGEILPFLGIKYEVGQLALFQGCLDEAQTWFEDGYRLSQEVNAPFYQIEFKGRSGRIRYYQGNNYQVRILHTAALTVLEQASYRLTAPVHRWLLSDLGDVARAEGEITEAVDWYLKSLALIQSMGIRPYAPARLEGLAKAMGMQGQTQRAVRLLAAAQPARDWLGLPRPSIDRLDYECNRDA